MVGGAHFQKESVNIPCIWLTTFCTYGFRRALIPPIYHFPGCARNSSVSYFHLRIICFFCVRAFSMILAPTLLNVESSAILGLIVFRFTLLSLVAVWVLPIWRDFSERAVASNGPFEKRRSEKNMRNLCGGGGRIYYPIMARRSAICVGLFWG